MNGIACLGSSELVAGHGARRGGGGSTGEQGVTDWPWDWQLAFGSTCELHSIHCCSKFLISRHFRLPSGIVAVGGNNPTEYFKREGVLLKNADHGGIATGWVAGHGARRVVGGQDWSVSLRHICSRSALFSGPSEPGIIILCIAFHDPTSLQD